MRPGVEDEQDAVCVLEQRSGRNGTGVQREWCQLQDIPSVQDDVGHKTPHGERAVHVGDMEAHEGAGRHSTWFGEAMPGDDRHEEMEE